MESVLCTLQLYTLQNVDRYKENFRYHTLYYWNLKCQRLYFNYLVNKNHTLHMNKEFLGLDDCIIRKTINAGTSIIVGKNEKLLYKILHRKQIYFLYG